MLARTPWGDGGEGDERHADGQGGRGGGGAAGGGRNWVKIPVRCGRVAGWGVLPRGGWGLAARPETDGQDGCGLPVTPSHSGRSVPLICLAAGP